MSSTERNLSNLTISESFYRLMQTDPVDDATLIDGTGSLVTYLIVSGTIDAFAFKGNGSQLTNLPTASLPSGLVSSSAQLGLSPSDSPTFANLTVSGKLTAQEFHTEFVSASIIYESGSTKFGNSSDDVHSFTGSLQVFGSITGSLFGTSSYSNFSNTASYINPLFISASVVAFGLSGASEWDEVLNKPAGLVSSSAQTIANLVGTNIVSGSGQRSVLGLGENDSPRFSTIYGTNGNFDGNVVVGGTLTARTYIISSSVVNYQTIQVSGSSKFGDSLDDKHQFTGSLDVLGSITGSLQGSASYALTASYALNAGGASINTGSFATTSSNTFYGDQIISASLEVSGATTIFGNLIPGGPYEAGGYTSSYSLGTSESVWRDLWVSNNSIHLVSGSGDVANISFDNGTISFKTNGEPAIVNLGVVNASGSNTITGSALVTGSLGVTGSVSVTGDLIVDGKITAQEFYTEFISSSVLYESGSTKFGNSLDDTHQFTGSLKVSGSLSVTGSFIVPNSELPVVSTIGSLAISGNDLWIYI